MTSSVDNPGIKDSRFANVKCKDAIVDRFNEKFSQRPTPALNEEGAWSIFTGRGSAANYFLIPPESPSRGGDTEESH